MSKTWDQDQYYYYYYYFIFTSCQSIKNSFQPFFSVWKGHSEGKHSWYMVMMDKDLGNHDLGLTEAMSKATRETKNGEKSNKCNQCDYASSLASDLRRHLKRHSGVKPNKCNQCDFASYHSGNLRRHLKTHSGDKQYKCNKCDFASSRANLLVMHMKRHIQAWKWRRCSQWWWWGAVAVSCHNGLPILCRIYCCNFSIRTFLREKMHAVAYSQQKLLLLLFWWELFWYRNWCCLFKFKIYICNFWIKTFHN